MFAIPLVALALLAAPQDPTSQAPTLKDPSAQKIGPPRILNGQPVWTPEQQEQIRQKTEQMKKSLEPRRKTAVRLNDLAGSLHTEADARKLVDGIDEELFGHRGPVLSEVQLWVTRSKRHRVAHAEFLAASGASGLIPEQRVVDVWNEYVREIGAPEDTLVTVAEVHNLRDGMYTGSQKMWGHGGFGQNIWMMPNIYALNPDGRVADGVRALEALKILHDMENSFLSVRSARERVQKGVFVSDMVQRPQSERPSLPSVELRVASRGVPLDEISSCARQYSRNHGQKAYDQLMERLFHELLPDS